MAKDMTQGNLVRTLAGFSIPLIFSGLLQQLYNWADAFIVGNVEGELALTGIGATTSLANLFVFAITGFTAGVSVQSAQLYGCGKREKLNKVLSSFVVILGGIFLGISVVSIFLTGPILQLLQTPPDIFELAKSYLRIVFFGIPFLAIYNVYASVLRGMGDSKIPFLSVAFSAAANVLLDLLFIGVFRFGVVGAAVATVISQVLMTVFLICYAVKKYPSLRFRFGREMMDFHIVKKGCKLGVPVTIQSSITSVGNLVLQNFMNGFGTQTVAAITTAYRVDTIILLPILNLGTEISTVTAQNIGAGNYRRARRSLFVGSGMMAIISVFLTVFVLFAGESMIAMFGVTETAVQIGAAFFHGIAWFYLLYGLSMALRGFLEGIGDVLFSSIGGIVSLAIRIVVSYCLADYWGNLVIAYAEVISWFVLFGIYLVRFLWKQWKAPVSTIQ